MRVLTALARRMLFTAALMTDESGSMFMVDMFMPEMRRMASVVRCCA